MYFPYHPTQLHYDPLQANRQIPPPTGYSKPNVQPFSSLDQPRLHAQPQSSYGHTLPPYVNSRHLSAMNQPPNPPNPPYVDVNSDFAKVWAACVDSYASSESRGMQQPINQHPLQHPTTLIQQYYALEPSADIHAKVSRWSQAIPHPPLPVPQQCLRAFEHPPRPDPPRRVHPAKTSSVSHQESVPRSAPQPVPEPNPLHRNEMLESPVALLQVPPKRGRNWPMPSTRVQVPTRSAQLLSQVTSPPHAPRAAAPVVSTMKRGHDDSPMVQPSPEDELDTPPDDAICLLLKQQVKRLPGSTDWIDDSPPHICGNNQSKPCQTPPYAIHDRGARTPFDDTHKEVAANALVKMYQRSKTDYSQPSQVSSPLSYRICWLTSRLC